MAVKDVISWTSMLQAYVEHGKTKDALQLFKEMQWEGIIPHKGTFVTILKACADLGALEQGRKVHATILARRLHTDEIVGTALIHMYARCGCVESAVEVFKTIQERNVHVCSAMMAAYAEHGYEKETLLLFQQMIMKGIVPNEVTMISVLSACSYAGLISEFQQHFSAMSKGYGVTPNCQHYACIIDLLGHGGLLEEAENLILTMPLEPDISVWRSMLTACTVHCDIERGKRAAENCMRLEPGYGAPYVLLSNILATDGKWDEVEKIKGLMEKNDAKQQPGRSSIEVREKIQDFVLEDGLHLQSEDLKVELDNLQMRLEEAGYTPQTSVPMHDVEEEIPLYMLKYHSERLAIVFGHIMTPPKSTLHIVKNMRMCYHCHEAIKFASQLLEREIIVRDSHRFHHFRQGLCSCRDYW